MQVNMQSRQCTREGGGERDVGDLTDNLVQVEGMRVCMTSIQTQGDPLRPCSLSLPNHSTGMGQEFLVGTWRLIDYWIEPWEEYLGKPGGGVERGMELWGNGNVGMGIPCTQ